LVDMSSKSSGMPRMPASRESGRKRGSGAVSTV
jgi:hypothetical protein